MQFELKLIWFWVLIFGALWYLRRRPDGLLARAALTWIGPLPTQGELWSRFQLRWAIYSCGWLLQFGVALSILYYATRIWPSIEETTWFKVLLFAVPLGLGMALLAVIGFVCKAAKARWLGPDPIFQSQSSAAGEA